ncbi:MAG: hypothetical protein C0595_11755 [Marinilabiliales bacterium]|nr:MAG: hypothetical protein C0595_11755 [Marinilabiliales bacterium]
MKHLPYLILFFLLTITISVIGQKNIWPKTFEGYAFQDIEKTYDNGFAFSGFKTNDLDVYFLGYGVLRKVDINGDILWEKLIVLNPPPAYTDLYCVNQTNDGGYIVSGQFWGRDFDGGDVFIMKLNACGELEWNTFIISDGPQICNDVYQLEDGSFLTTIGQWDLDQHPADRIWLFKLSSQGKIIWHKLQADWNPIQNNERLSSFSKSPDDNYIISGSYFGYDNNYMQQPMFIKVDTAGNEIWHDVVTGSMNDPHEGRAFFGGCDSNGNFYSAGNHMNTGHLRAPVIYKISNDGATLFAKDIFTEADSLERGITYDVKCMTDTTLFTFINWLTTYDSVFAYIYKLDSSGNTIARKIIDSSNSYYLPLGSATTIDNKYVIVGSYANQSDDVWSSSFWKLQSNLEYDTIYTQQFNYDSLCPYPITNDTIPLDTTTVINLEHLWNDLKPMSIFPNPVKNKLNIIINIVKWQQRQLIIRDINGREVINENIAPGSANHQLDVSTLENGIYVVSLLEKGKLLQTEKVVVSH